MTDISGNEFDYNAESFVHENGILVTNGKIHDVVIEKYSQLKNNG